MKTIKHISILVLMILGTLPSLGAEKVSQIQLKLREAINPVRLNKQYQIDYYVYKSKDIEGRRKEDKERLQQESNAVYTAVLSVLKGRTKQELFDSNSAIFPADLLDAEVRGGIISVVVNDGLYRITPQVKDGIIIDIKMGWMNIDVPWDDPGHGIFQPCGITKTNHNQQVDPTVKTPVESGKEQGTAGHP